MKKFFLETLFPQNCLLCQKEKFLLCPDCQKTVPLKFFPHCPACGDQEYFFEFCPACKKKNNFSLDGIFIAGFWKDPLLRKIIYLFKYDFVLEAGKILQGTLSDFVKNHQIAEQLMLNQKDIVVCPVPLHPRRLNWRGFNQSELLAQTLAQTLPGNLKTGVLRRVRETQPQMSINNARGRKLNVYEAFCLEPAVKKEDFKDKVLFIADDITTTGATLNECAKTLKKLRPKKIYGFVIAQA